jgi:hypothetical protein
LLKQVGASELPAKLLSWQIWHEKKLPSPIARLAHTPCCWTAGATSTHSPVVAPVIVPWWHPAVFPKQEVREIPP